MKASRKPRAAALPNLDMSGLRVPNILWATNNSGMIAWLYWSIVQPLSSKGTSGSSWIAKEKPRTARSSKILGNKFILDDNNKHTKGLMNEENPYKNGHPHQAASYAAAT